MQLDNPGPVDYQALTEDPFTGQPPATYQQKLERFYNLALATNRRKKPLYESIEAAARKRLTDVPEIFRLDVTAAMNISKRAYRQGENGYFVPTQDPAVMRDNWPNGAAPNASRADVEALVASITAKCLLIKFDSWQEDFWTKAHQPLLEHYRECEIATVSGPHHAFAMKKRRNLRERYPALSFIRRTKPDVIVKRNLSFERASSFFLYSRQMQIDWGRQPVRSLPLSYPATPATALPLSTRGCSRLVCAW